jgi:hypothetical protein
MITEKEYLFLWNKHFQEITNQEIPSYKEYLKRKEFFETYLKTLRGSEVKYILIAEAAPFHDITKSKFGPYFYNFKNVKGLKTRYFSAPCKAFDVNYETPSTTEIAKNSLNDLAKKGVLLLDLFPFALKIDSTLRKKISGRGIVKHFWDGDDYSIKKQIKDLCANHTIKLHAEWDLCLIAPPLISCHLVGAYEELNVSPLTNGNHNQKTFKAIQPADKRGCDHKKVASDTSGYPSVTLIKIAFDLLAE